MKTRVLAVLLAALLIAPAFAGDSLPPAFRIAIEVTVPDEDLRKRIEMYLRNELRSLGDVEVTSENPDFKVYSMITEVRTSTGGRIAEARGAHHIQKSIPVGFRSFRGRSHRNRDELNCET